MADGPLPDEPADEELLARFVAGDADAFGALVARHRDRVYAICWRFFRDDADAEDATQEAFVALYRGASSFQGTARFSTWMYRVATNTCHDLRRRRVRRPQSAGVDVDQVGATSVDEIGGAELDIDLDRALARLRPEHREVIELHVLRGVPYAEIAERTGVAMGTVKSRIHRATAQLAGLLATDDGEHARPPVLPTQQDRGGLAPAPGDPPGRPPIPHDP
ncbi:RNA polymerase sigma factor [Euzebya sp.]|uniref:RNA polymerase sigma factor n=1 Tax=Euzebya sp. TaxID=1971409 RepID=UPI0035199F7E